jgi:hypothetical protein
MKDRKQPGQLLNLPELARRLGLFYSQVYVAFKDGELVPDFLDNLRRPLFLETSLVSAIGAFRKVLTADEYLALASRINASDDTDKLRLVDVTGTIFVAENGEPR